MPVKRKIRGIFSLGIVILLLFNLLALAAPASAGVASWSAESISSTLDNVLGPSGIDIRDIAVAAGGTTIYAVTGDSASDNIVYKSTSTGTSWTTLNIPIEADLIAIAPDDDDMMIIANSSTPAVYITIDGGSTWFTLGTPQETGGAAAAAIYDVAISKASDSIHYIATAGKETGDVANVWYYNSGAAAPVWTETNTLAGFSSGDEVRAVAFSPNFPEDKVMVALSEDDSDSVDLQIFSFYANKWNNSASFPGYPITIASNSGITGLASASISLAPDYLASESSRRTIFIGLTVTISGSNTGGIYRVTDNSLKGLKTQSQIHSVAYNGSSLVAGRYDAISVYRSANPMATTPTVSAVASLKGPGGENKVVVAWASSTVAAGTSGDESAFAVSTDNGATFNDLNLIDTAITNARDVAASADSSKVYLVTDDGTDLSLWRKVSVWKRILSLQGTTDYIVRIAPDNADVIYLAREGTTTIYNNKSGGNAEWFTRTGNVNIQDLAVESTDVIYALDSAGSVSKATNAGFTWETAKSTGLDSGATIVSISPNNLLVGSQDGYVAYSTNGNSTWTEITKVLQSGAGNVQVIADDGFASNKIIYAASDAAGQDIKRWQIGTSSVWTDIFSGTLTGGIYGLGMDGGTLYALEFNAGTGQSTMWQVSSPTTLPSPLVDWSARATTTSTDADDTEVHLNATPRALKVSSGKLWAVKTNGTNKLYSLTDILIKIGALSPASDFINPVNTASGIAHDITFTWGRPIEATEYELQIALDEDFTLPIATITIPSEESSVLVVVGQYQTGNTYFNFTPGTKYYWRVRTTQPLYSFYSETRDFTIESLVALVPDLLTPANGSTDVRQKPAFSWEPISGAAEYQFVLSANATMPSPVIDTQTQNAAYTMTEELDYGTTYFWKVRAIEPVETDWSILANFTVKEKPVESVPPSVVYQFPPSPPPIINAPEATPPNIITLAPPPTAPSPAAPDYIRATVIIAIALLLVIVALLVKYGTVRPFRVVKDFGDWLRGPGGSLGQLREGLITYFKGFNPLRTFRGVKPPVATTGAVAASHPVSFAAESFLWMITSEVKDESQHLLSADEEQSLGKILASRIQTLAKDQLLYQKFPKDTASFLYLWSHYGSRDETNRYLIKSFQSRPENVIGLLKCYLPTPVGQEPGLGRQTGFSQTQYDSVAKVVDTEKVYEALARLYGPELDRPEGKESDYTTDKAIASQFTRIHKLVKSKISKTGQTIPPKEAGMVKVDAR